MVSHANAHPNIVSQFLVPLIIWRTLRLAEPGRWLRNGVLLGLLIVWQAFINLEILLMTAIALAVVIGAMVIGRPRLRRASAGRSSPGSAWPRCRLAVLLAYPLYVQFFGPRSYHGLSRFVRGYGTDLGAFVGWSRESLAGDAAVRRSAGPEPHRGERLLRLAAGRPRGRPGLRGCAATPVVLGLAGARAALRRPVARPGDQLNGRRHRRPRRCGGCCTACRCSNSAVPTRWAHGDRAGRRGCCWRSAASGPGTWPRGTRRPGGDPRRHGHRARDGAGADRADPAATPA